MKTHLRYELAELWQRILRSDPKAIFGGQYEKLQRRHWGDEIPQPGFVGGAYQPGGLVFVSMNPGGGQDIGPDDRRQFEVLQRLRDAEVEHRTATFEQLTEVLVSIMPRWKIHQNFVAPILSCANMVFSDVGYLNLLKWRTKRSSSLNRLYDLSWYDDTQAQIDLLAPRTVMAVGADAGRAFRRHYPANIEFDFIPRVIGNNIGREGQESINRICSTFFAEVR